jgi:hypothetical protein
MIAAMVQWEREEIAERVACRGSDPGKARNALGWRRPPLLGRT